jgi:hypothetical protein
MRPRGDAHAPRRERSLRNGAAIYHLPCAHNMTALNEGMRYRE